ncbi:MAG: hypothetical protein LBL41_00760 [Bifidobacteriaceae bacterium]|jgi:hypothetical protein|nr:hypothetical protein [Bifidobacteriaceae bacterium]
MITLKKKLTGALMAFALVTSVLVGGAGAPEVEAANSPHCSYGYNYTDYTYTTTSVTCSSAYKMAAKITYSLVDGYVNTPILSALGAYVTGGNNSTATRPKPSYMGARTYDEKLASQV